MDQYLKSKIIPYKGIETFSFGKTLAEVRAELKERKVHFNQSTDPHKGCTPEIPWTFISIFDSITLCFVEDILFEIVLENKYEGKLGNGIGIGTSLKDVESADYTIKYNEDDEDYISEAGYWFEIDPDTDKVSSITVYVPEADDSTLFFKYEWIEKYRDGYLN